MPVLGQRLCFDWFEVGRAISTERGSCNIVLEDPVKRFQDAFFPEFHVHARLGFEMKARHSHPEPCDYKSCRSLFRPRFD